MNAQVRRLTRMEKKAEAQRQAALVAWFKSLDTNAWNEEWERLSEADQMRLLPSLIERLAGEATPTEWAALEALIAEIEASRAEWRNWLARLRPMLGRNLERWLTTLSEKELCEQILLRAPDAKGLEAFVPEDRALWERATAGARAYLDARR